MPRNPCPVPYCNGFVFAKRFAEVTAFACDGHNMHSDSEIRHHMIAEASEAIAGYEASLDAIERRIDPVGWLHDRVAEARLEKDIRITDEDLMDFASLPPYSTGISNRKSTSLLHLRGMTTLSGKASSGKSWFALGAALHSAYEGWNVHYIAAEADDVIKRRIYGSYGRNPPRSFRLHSIEPGVTADDILDSVSDWICSTRTLLVIDSLSTLLQFMRGDSNENRWDAQARLEVFLMSLRALTRGEVSIINVSEANAAGESKGRTIDHRSDISLNFRSIEETGEKEIRVMKSWEGDTGLLGRAIVDPSTPGLELVFKTVSEEPVEGDAF